MQNHKHVSQAIKSRLEPAQRVLFIAHKKPDGDAIGSNLGLAHYLEKIGKEVHCFCDDQVPNDLKFLPKTTLFTDDHTIFSQKFDIVFVLDCATLNLAGVQDLIKVLPGDPVIINIDHHISNPRFGHINLVIDDASSTAEVVYRLLKDWQIDWHPDIAHCLACGLITDTGGLKNPATTYRTLHVASELIGHGADVYKVVRQTMRKSDPNKLKLIGRALERLQKVEKYGLVYTYILQKDYQECGLTDGDSEGIANLLHILNEGNLVLVLRESKENEVKGSLRTIRDIDLSRLAGLFGGGGHRQASGFSLPGRLVYDNNKLKIV